MFVLWTATSLMAGLLRHPPRRLAAYLWAELVYIPFVLCAAWYFGIWSKVYASIYVFFTAFILYAIIRFTLDCLRSRQYRLRAVAIALLFAAVLTKMAIAGVSRPLSGYAAINLGEAFVLAWAGILCLFVSPYMKRPDLIFPLGALWACQSAFRFGWSINFSHWVALNWLIPPMLGCLAFSFLAYRLSFPQGRLARQRR